ncbi:tryptophan-rich protein [Plasmodium ovale]|uniref:Tryptophan-rich protein n=1 Tax=Plasmodium ovale TaxID=36330 RepID=A0A1D3JFC2_PLAOA|nr:tryptophan-rich protein [Plasmodium ovale]
MELGKDLLNNVSNTFFQSNSEDPDKNHLLSDVNENFVVAVIYVLLFIFTCYSVISMSYYSTINKKKKRVKQESLEEICFDQMVIRQSEELKKNAWNSWMTRLELEWQYFDSTLEEKKKNWLETKEKDWEEWLTYINCKWNNYHKYMDKSYKYYILKISLTWNQMQWENWVKAEAKHFVQIEWEKWIHKNDYDLSNWIYSEWNEWKNNKITSWLEKNWKRKEEEYWKKMTKRKWAKSLFKRIQKNWNKWNKRIKRESKQWNKWVLSKENLYTNNLQWENWTTWKDNKRVQLTDLKENLAKMWISEKKWAQWIEERHNLIMMEKYMANM